MQPLAPLPPRDEQELTDEELSAYEQQKLDVDENKSVAAVSYVPFLSLVALIARRESVFVQYHARQGTVGLCLALIALIFPFWLRMLAELGVFGLLAFGFSQAAQGRWVRVPVLIHILEGRGVSRTLGVLNVGFEGARDTVKTVTQRTARTEAPAPTEEPPGDDAPPAASPGNPG